ncbi:MAG: hypothetical protein KTV77_05140 [Wolbachia endosymbiont of Fragariocoptes setiger]|nr:hypothetical protein [Wolbachia endosymbiont of Fragariocoptes setiger]
MEEINELCKITDGLTKLPLSIDASIVTLKTPRNDLVKYLMSKQEKIKLLP